MLPVQSTVTRGSLVWTRSPAALLLLAAALVALANTGPVGAWWLFDSPGSFGAQVITKAEAKFDMDGVKGAFKFTQTATNAPTLAEYDLTGLKGNNQLYHVHVRPLPAFDPEKVRNNATAIAALCGDPATGGHLNPHHITAKLPPKSAPLDKYELGDLSGKHGPLTRANGTGDRYVGSFTDDKLPMTGENSIVGRSIVIHKNDGKRWVCATIKEVAY